jgi:hypothetical protein
VRPAECGVWRRAWNDAASWRWFVARPLPDIAALVVLLAVGLPMVRPLLHGRDAATGAGDWHAHAFRVEELGRYGPAPWSHTWAGGMPLWEGYQGVPHVITLAIVRWTGLPTTRAMLALVACVLVLLWLSMYAVLRWAGAMPAAALAGVMAAAALDTVRQPSANYTELWGLALSPLALFAGYRWSGRWGGLVVAALIGLSVEVHPLLAVTGAIGLAAGFLAGPHGRSVGMPALQGLFVAGGAALFWLPVALSSRPAYSEPYFASAEFARLLFRLAAAGFARPWPAAAAAAALVCLACLRSEHRKAPARFLLAAGGAVALIAGAGLVSGAPEAVYGAQLTRLLGVVPLLIGAAAALAATAAWCGIRTGAATWALAVALAAAAGVRGAGGPLHITMSDGVDSGSPAALAAAAAIDGRVWLDPVMTSRSSHDWGSAVRFAGSYSGREWSLLHGPLEYFLTGHGSARNRAAYLVVHGVSTLVLPADVRPAIVDPRDGETPLEWRFVAGAGGYDVLAPPWPVSSAWLLPAAVRDALTVPDRRFRDVASSYIRDEYVARLAKAALENAVPPFSVTYPDGGSITVDLAGLEPGWYLMISENWDRYWQATAGDRRLAVERVGPNLIGVDTSGLSGDLAVQLTHRRPPAVPAGLVLSLLSLAAAVVVVSARHVRRRGMM